MPAEVAVLTQLAGDLRDFLEDPAPAPDDPLRARLYPRAYLDPTEEKAEDEWQGLVHSDLAEGRRRALELFTATLERATPARKRLEITLAEEETAAWLGVVNDIRLALGTRLDVSDDLDPSDIGADDPAGQAYAIYWWLGAFQEDLLAALMSGPR